MTIPSIVTFDDQGQPVVGKPAERRMAIEPEATIYGSKRLLGRAYLSGVGSYFQPHFNYELVPHDGFVAAKICGRVLPLTEVSALILEKSAARRRELSRTEWIDVW